MANLATAELWYNAGDMKKALIFATRAHGKLPQGSADWQRAGDIIGAAAPWRRSSEDNMRDFVITLAGAIGGAALAVAIVFTWLRPAKLPNQRPPDAIY